MKIIMMTGFSVEQLLKEAVEHGALEVLYKPIDIEKVLTLIRKIMRNLGIILVADDDKDFVDSITHVIEDEGYKVYVAHDGQEAIKKVEENGIDLLILDLNVLEFRRMKKFFHD